MKLTSHLIFNGQAEEAANYYANLLGGKVEGIWRYESMPAQAGMPEVPSDFMQKILHCDVNYAGGSISIGDTLPSDPRNFGSGGHMLTIWCDSIAHTEEVYAKLCADAQKIQCELSEVYFAKRYAEVVDRYGVLWALIYEEA